MYKKKYILFEILRVKLYDAHGVGLKLKSSTYTM